MKKVYHLLSVALLGAMALTSCEEDKIVNENNGEGNETDKNLTDYSFIASIKQSAPLGRSNLQNGVYTNRFYHLLSWFRRHRSYLIHKPVRYDYSTDVFLSYN